MKKWLIIAASVLLILIVGLVLTYRIVLSKNFLVAQIEESINSRVQVGSFGVNPFSVPAKVVIKDVVIAERDEVADSGVPHDKRERLGSDKGVIRVDEIAFDLSLRDLFARQIKVSELKVTGFHGDLVMNQEGEINFAKLLAAPPKEAEKEPESLNAKESRDFVSHFDRLRIKDASFDLLIEKTGMVIEGREVNLDLTDIRVDPNALEKVNEAKLEFSARFAAFSSGREREKYAQIGLDGPAQVRLFDPASGVLNPHAEIDFKIAADSYVSAKAPYIAKLWSLTDKLVQFGLTTKPLPDQLPFGRDRVLKAGYANSRLDLHEPVSLLLDTWELVLGGGSWVAFGSEQHQSSVRLIASEKATALFEAYLAKLLDALPKEIRVPLQQQTREKLYEGDRLRLEIGTHGPLSDPEADLITRLPDLKQAIKDYAATRALDFLRDKLNE